MPTQQHRPGLNAMFPRHRDNPGITHERGSRTAQRRVRRDVDPFLPAEIHNIVLRQVRMVFDLIHGWRDLGGLQELCEVAHAVVADAYGAGLACGEEGFHLRPGLRV